MDTAYELIKLIKKSPRRDAAFQKLKEKLPENSPGIRVLCPTRWTSIMKFYKCCGRSL